MVLNNKYGWLLIPVVHILVDYSHNREGHSRVTVVRLNKGLWLVIIVREFVVRYYRERVMYRERLAKGIISL
jgi:hypothetical protein